MLKELLIQGVQLWNVWKKLLSSLIQDQKLLLTPVSMLVVQAKTRLYLRGSVRL